MILQRDLLPKASICFFKLLFGVHVSQIHYDREHNVESWWQWWGLLHCSLPYFTKILMEVFQDLSVIAMRLNRLYFSVSKPSNTCAMIIIQETTSHSGFASFCIATTLHQNLQHLCNDVLFAKIWVCNSDIANKPSTELFRVNLKGNFRGICCSCACLSFSSPCTWPWSLWRVRTHYSRTQSRCDILVTTFYLTQVSSGTWLLTSLIGRISELGINCLRLLSKKVS